MSPCDVLARAPAGAQPASRATHRAERLMAAPLGRTPLELTVRDLVSRPYVDMTLAMMKQFGDEISLRLLAPATHLLTPVRSKRRDLDVGPEPVCAKPRLLVLPR